VFRGKTELHNLGKPSMECEVVAVMLCNKHLISCQPLTFLVLLFIMIFAFPADYMI